MSADEGDRRKERLEKIGRDKEEKGGDAERMECKR